MTCLISLSVLATLILLGCVIMSCYHHLTAVVIMVSFFLLFDIAVFFASYYSQGAVAVKDGIYKEGYLDALYNRVEIDTISLDKDGFLSDFKVVKNNCIHE